MYGQRQGVPTSPSNRRQKTVPINGHTPYNQSPRPHPNNKHSPRPSKRKKNKSSRDKDKRNKHNSNIQSDAHRIRSQTTTNGVNNNKWHNNNQSSPRPMPPQSPSNHHWRSHIAQNQMSPHPMAQPKNTYNHTHAHTQWNNNSNVVNVQTYAHHNNINNLYSDNSLSNSTSHTTPIPVASVYQSRKECVWNIDLFQKKDVAKNFSCLECGDIPRYTISEKHKVKNGKHTKTHKNRQKFAYICNKDKIYCEHCIDLKLRQGNGMDIKLKNRMPLMVQNMILDLKVKCPRYAQCKYRGTLRGLTEHEIMCKNAAKKAKKTDIKVKECPLKYIGCTGFNGGYLKQHYDEYQQQHLDVIINYFETKLNKMDKKYNKNMNELKQQNEELRDEIDKIHIAKDQMSSELMDLRREIKKMQKEKDEEYKIVVNTPPSMNEKIESPQKNQEWNSFINAHRRLSTKTGATIPENEQKQQQQISNGNRMNLLSQQTQSFATQNSSIHSDMDQGWYRNDYDPLIDDKKGMNNKQHKLQNEMIENKENMSVNSADNLINIIDIDDDEDDTIKTNTTTSTITTTDRVNRINAKLKQIKQKQQKKKLQKRSKQPPKISLLNETHSLKPYAYNITINESETSELSMRDIDESSSVSNQRPRKIKSYSHMHHMGGNGNKTMQKLSSQFMSHSYQPHYIQQSSKQSPSVPSILSITDSAQSPPIQRPITPYATNYDDEQLTFDDSVDDLTVTSRNYSNYSCTISVRRAIQHLVPNYCLVFVVVCFLLLFSSHCLHG